jgi:putative FmdB family regulatory protein
VPTYQYACTECGEHLEVVQSFSDPALTVCPACEGKLRKVFNSVGIVFKGSGFYRNDSRSGSASAEKSDGASPSADSADAPKSDSPSSAPSSTSPASSTSPSSSSSSKSDTSSGSSGSTAKAAATPA